MIRFIVLVLTLVVIALIQSPDVLAQQTGGKVFRLGWVSLSAPQNPERLGTLWLTLKARLAERGYIEGKNIKFEPRWADSNDQRVPDLLAELERSGVDVVVAPVTRNARISQNHLKKTPLIVYSCDPFEHVARLSRQGATSPASRA